jgi:hypothetical protein
MVPVARSLILCAACALPFSAHASGTRILVPAYANPCCAGGPALWSGVNAFAAAQPQQVGVVFNPASGPGSSPVDPNYVDATGHGPLVDLLATGAPVYGYVATTNATKPLATAENEIALYYDDSGYWRGQPIHLAGIFFDEMSNDLANVGYYQSLRDAVRAHDANAYIVGNPGVSGTINPSSQTTYSATDFGSVFNAVLVFENYDDVFAGYGAPTWQNASGAAQLAIVVHTTPDALHMRYAMSRAFTHGAAWLYITDATEPNPYVTLPQFWTEETQLLLDLVFVDGFE